MREDGTFELNDVVYIRDGCDGHSGHVGCFGLVITVMKGHSSVVLVPRTTRDPIFDNRDIGEKYQDISEILNLVNSGIMNQRSLWTYPNKNLRIHKECGKSSRTTDIEYDDTWE